MNAAGDWLLATGCRRSFDLWRIHRCYFNWPLQMRLFLSPFCTPGCVHFVLLPGLFASPIFDSNPTHSMSCIVPDFICLNLPFSSPHRLSPLRPFSLSQLRAPLCISLAGIATHKLIGFFDCLDLFAVEYRFETFVDKTCHLNDTDSCFLQDRQRFRTCSASQ